MKRIFAISLTLLLLLAGCADEPGELPERLRPAQPAAEYAPYTGPTLEEYMEQVVQGAVDKIDQPGMSEYERAKAAYDYLLEIGCYRWSPALDLWRIRTMDDATPDFVQARAISFLTHGMGTCEDYSSALVLLLEAMGMEAQYLPGLTYSADGELVFHAWALARVEGVWYHLDCQLEDKISDDGTVRYKYFLKGDETMMQSHVWGRRLIAGGYLREDQNAEIAEQYLGEPCPQNFPTPPSREIPVTRKPDDSAVISAYLRELADYESAYGKKEYRAFEILPPVFGRYGGYSTSEDFALRSPDYIETILASRLLIQPDQDENE